MSDLHEPNELVLTQVEVRKDAFGELLYKVPYVYVTRPSDYVTLEILKAQEKGAGSK